MCLAVRRAKMDVTYVRILLRRIGAIDLDLEKRGDCWRRRKEIGRKKGKGRGLAREEGEGLWGWGRRRRNKGKRKRKTKRRCSGILEGICPFR